MAFYYGSLEDTTWNSALLFNGHDVIVILHLVTRAISRAWPHFVHGYFRPHTGFKASQLSITGLETSLYVEQTLCESDYIFVSHLGA